MATEKTERIGIRMTPAEKENLLASAAGARMSVSAYIMSLSEGKKITVAEKVPQLLLEITRIGTNINQIAHIANSQKFVSREQLGKVIELMGDVKAAMQKILSELYDNDEHDIRTLERKIDNLMERIDSSGDS